MVEVEEEAQQLLTRLKALEDNVLELAREVEEARESLVQVRLPLRRLVVVQRAQLTRDTQRLRHERARVRTSHLAQAAPHDAPTVEHATFRASEDVRLV